MTWGYVTSTGSGGFGLRLVVEGLGFQFVTDEAMQLTLPDGRERICSLKRDGIVIEELVHPAEARIKAGGFTAQFVDRQIDDAITRAMFTRPSLTTWLTADATTSTNVLSVLSDDGWAADQVVHVGTEAILIEAAAGNQFTGCVRAYWDTIAQAHYTLDGAGVSRAAVTDLPYTLEGRRVYLWAYGEGDDPLGDGTLIWRGILATDASLGRESTKWSLVVDPITRLLDQDLGKELTEPIEPRGIYYSRENPLHLHVAESDTASEFVATPTGGVPPFDRVFGFFENNDALCREVTTRLQAMAAGGGLTLDAVRAVCDGDNDWWIEVVVDAATPRFPFVGFTSAIDGTSGYMLPHSGGAVLSGIQDAAGNRVSTVTAGGIYKTFAAPAGVAGSRACPRGYFGRPPPESSFRIRYDETPLAVVLDPRQVYLSGVGDVTGVSAANYEFAVVDSGEASGSWFVSFVDAPVRSVTFNPVGASVDAPYTREQPLRLEFAGGISAEHGDLSFWRNELVARAPVEANLGIIPFITDSDLSPWSSPVDLATRGRAWLDQRAFILGGDISVKDFLAQECRLLGLMPCLDFTGRITLRPFGVTTDTDRVVATLSWSTTDPRADNSLVDDGFASIERNKLGSFNTIIVKLDYDPIEEEHRREVSVRDQTAYSLRKTPKELEIAPISRYRGDGDPSNVRFEQIVGIAAPILGVFGREYAIVQSDVPLSLFHVLVGDKIGIDLPHLPDGRGGRGLDKNGLVIGRRWELDRGRGMLTILVSYENVAGWTPTVTVTAQANVAGNTWDLTVKSNDPYDVLDWYPAGVTLGAHFVAGDQVAVHEWDVASPTEVTGAVVSVTGTTTGPATGTIRVTFDGVWVPGGSTWTLNFDPDSADNAERQRLYCYFANTDGRIGHTVAVPARVWSA